MDSNTQSNVANKSLSKSSLYQDSTPEPVRKFQYQLELLEKLEEQEKADNEVLSKIPLNESQQDAAIISMDGEFAKQLEKLAFRHLSILANMRFDLRRDEIPKTELKVVLKELKNQDNQREINSISFKKMLKVLKAILIDDEAEVKSVADFSKDLRASIKKECSSKTLSFNESLSFAYNGKSEAPKTDKQSKTLPKEPSAKILDTQDFSIILSRGDDDEESKSETKIEIGSNDNLKASLKKEIFGPQDTQGQEREKANDISYTKKEAESIVGLLASNEEEYSNQQMTQPKVSQTSNSFKLSKDQHNGNLMDKIENPFLKNEARKPLGVKILYLPYGQAFFGTTQVFEEQIKKAGMIFIGSDYTYGDVNLNDSEVVIVALLGLHFWKKESRNLQNFLSQDGIKHRYNQICVLHLVNDSWNGAAGYFKSPILNKEIVCSRIQYSKNELSPFCPLENDSISAVLEQVKANIGN